jgi:hypothetical protein
MGMRLLAESSCPIANRHSLQISAMPALDVDYDPRAPEPPDAPADAGGESGLKEDGFSLSATR